MKMDRETRAFIQRLQSDAPVNIVGISKVLGLNVWESQTLPDGVAGKLFRDRKNGGGGGYSIIVRAQDPVVRKRFTIAHELAHYLLHRHLFSDELVDNALYRSGLSTPIEAQANALAADLLMPWHLLMPEIGQGSVKDLATKFEVSEQAMEIRIASGVRPSTVSALV